eukprot:134495_1
MTRFFQSVSTNIIIPICVITIVQSQPSKRVVLTSQSTETDGAHVAIIGASGEVTSSSTSWDITSLNPETWHLEVNLDNSWGFDPNYESNITLEIDGTDLVQNTIFAFSNPTLDRFIITRIRSSQFHANTISPFCSPSTTIMLIADASTLFNGCQKHSSSRVQCKMSSYTDINMIQGDVARTFPIKFTLTNTPGQSLQFMLELGATESKGICIFKAFDTDVGLRIYFAVDDNQTCAINSLNVTYSTAAPIINTTTDAPTAAHITTDAPTLEPVVTADPTTVMSTTPVPIISAPSMATYIIVLVCISSCLATCICIYLIQKVFKIMRLRKAFRSKVNSPIDQDNIVGFEKEPGHIENNEGLLEGKDEIDEVENDVESEDNDSIVKALNQTACNNENGDVDMSFPVQNNA